MSDLPVNYLDDILAESMGGKRKFKITHANGSTEEVTIEDISEYAQIGSTFGAGDINKTNQAVNEKFDSGDVVDPMLTTEEGFAADAYKTKMQFDEQNKNIQNTNTKISKIKTYVGSDGKLHFVDSAGADSVLPFKSNNLVTGKATSNNYKVNFGKDKQIQGFVIMASLDGLTTNATYIRSFNASKVLYGVHGYAGAMYDLSKVMSYNSATGVVTLTDLNNLSTFYYAIW